MAEQQNQFISITPLLRKLEDSSATIAEIVDGVALIFHNRVSPVQAAGLLIFLNVSGLANQADVIAQCAGRLRESGTFVDCELLGNTIGSRRAHGSYRGGLCTIEGTGGDGHSTFNVSTTAAIIASSVVFVAKHGAGASSSKCGAADILRAIADTPPVLEAVNPSSMVRFYEEGSFAFLFSPIFYPAMKHIAPVRRELGFKTIFNILGPLAHPLNSLIEARVVGVAQRQLGPIYAQALRLSGAKKTLIVCGAEDLDEISCAGTTFCWRIIEDPEADLGSRIEEFQLQPSDFGLPSHSLSQTFLGKEPVHNAHLLMQMLRGELPRNDPTLDFCLMNAAALFVVAGVCDDESHINESVRNDEIGPGGGRWKEGVRRALQALESGLAQKAMAQYIQNTRRNSL